MMRKNNQNRNNMKHRNNGGGQRRYQNNGHNNNNRAHDSGNIQRQKHHATQQLGKYNDLARNAQINGDRVDVEYYLQHVEHYSRVLADIALIEAERYAHQREQQTFHTPEGGQEAPATEAAESNGSAPTGEQDATPDASAEAAAAPAPQPRPRQPRRPANPHAAASSGNGAAEANSNVNDIPLPDSILPPV